MAYTSGSTLRQLYSKLVATVSDFLTVGLSLDAGPVRKGWVRRPEEKTTVRKSLTVVTSLCEPRSNPTRLWARWPKSTRLVVNGHSGGHKSAAPMVKSLLFSVTYAPLTVWQSTCLYP